MTDIIRLSGITVSSRHGVYPHEKETDQPFVVDVAMWVDASRAMITDDLMDTVDYVAVAKVVRDTVLGPSRNLIETLAGDIARATLAMSRIERVEVTVHKPGIDVGVPCDEASVTVSLERGQS